MKYLSLLYLNEDVIVSIALQFSMQDIFSFCLTCLKFNQIISQNQYFWELKLIKDFGFINNNLNCWKSMYQSYINDVWVFGRNHYSQLGLNDDVDRSIPILISEFKANQMACGSYHTVMIDINHNIWVFGAN